MLRPATPADAVGRVGALDPAVLRLAVEVCPCGMIVVGSDGAIKTVNGEIERLFGYTRDELLGKQIEILLPQESRDRHVAHRSDFVLRPGARHFGSGRDFNGRRKDGSEIPIEVSLNPICIGDEHMVVSAIVDISERKRLDHMQNDFVATVSHELRTPMTSIAASLGLLLAGAAETLPQPAVHLLQIAHGNCQRLVRMVDDILDLKKLDSGKMVFNVERCDARALLEKAIEANQGFAGGCGVKMHLEATPGAVMLAVDPDRFIQVVTNLLSNALKFSPSGETVTVALERRGGHVRIAVRDHGPGIPAEFRPRAFQSFAQAAGGRKGGSGLGLSIAQQIVTGMHGRIGFDDAPGGGTVFYVDLPGADHVARRQGDAAAAGSAG
jgi:PAS domain S-box-containing protein